MDVFLTSLQMVTSVEVLIVILLSAVYGMLVGCIPGLSATMATALLVPITFYLSPVAAVAAIISASAMAIFSGDIPGALLRIPGTPASAAYTEEAYAFTKRGEPETALGISLWFSAIGGVFGTMALVLIAPALAELALEFSSFEYFWLGCLGLLCASLVSGGSKAKAMVALLLGLLVACVGMENAAGTPRFTFGSIDLLSGVDVIAALVGVFAVGEVMRAMVTPEQTRVVRRRFGSILAGQWQLTKRYKTQMMRGNVVGVMIGVLPGAGADMAAWVSYAISKRFSRTPEKFGTGHPEGLVEAGSANNASLAGGWVPSLLFGIPGDTITAIAIGVLYMKGLNPGPTLFTQNAASMYSIYWVFLIANIIMVPLGILMIRGTSFVLRVPRWAIMSSVLLCSAVGAYAVSNSMFSILLVAAFGVIGYALDRYGYSVAAFVLGLVMGPMIEQNFVTSLIKSGGSILPFFDRPAAAVLAALTLSALFGPLVLHLLRQLRQRRPA
ncbi:MAG: C4-dicarboxylate ABC transporter permease [Rhodobacteraceae bacterium GWE1_64_9]|nr:MAG: C4-dicarboxylate ABC transporter permease [Rhodobacteraceae bacterium GWE1_64_9]OHC48112.1 MAG: C4-dicarboxylate ABC transporter permease [Rhodobacteraceae bacterium GWF1_65_7]HBD91718.1 C4-dicarboxylate ABC transporter permease [Gemmobacter sp.]HBU14365.1 C4-dicarboxylate ABC transporter permease [Gemmobacter sp.]